MRHPAHHTRVIARAICLLALLTGLSFWSKLASLGSGEERKRRFLAETEREAQVFPVNSGGGQLLSEVFSFFLEVYR